MYRLLLVEDDFDINVDLKDYIEENCKEDYKLDIAFDFYDGFRKIREGTYDLVILDVGLSKKADPALRKLISRTCRFPLIFIVDMTDEDEVEYVYGLDATRLIVKPFTASNDFGIITEYFKESAGQYTDIIEYGGIMMNPGTGLVSVSGTPVELPKKASELLRVLLENKGNIVSRDILLKEVWGEEYSGSDRVVDSQIRTLRRFLGNSGDLIRSIKGKGYGIGVN